MHLIEPASERRNFFQFCLCILLIWSHYPLDGVQNGAYLPNCFIEKVNLLLVCRGNMEISNSFQSQRTVTIIFINRFKFW